MLATPSLDYQGPKRHRASCDAADRWLDNPWVVDGVLVLVDDLDAHHEQASPRVRRSFARLENGPAGRLYTAEDPEGHRWMFQQR